MTYTGKTGPGRPATTRELAGLSITKLSVGGRTDNNAYLLRCLVTDRQLLVDAANDADRLLALLNGRGLSTVVTTHRHWDHWQALAEVVRVTGAQVLAHPDDADAIPVPTAPLRGGDVVRLGECVLEAIHLRGHTPGSVALLYDDPNGHPHLWTGDSLFPGGPGKTTDPDSFASLMDDLERRVFGRLPDTTWFYPGHGDDSTLGAERDSLGEWRARGW